VAALLLALAATGCKHDLDTDRADARADALVDGAAPDRASPDRATLDRAVPDTAVADKAVPDTAIPDKAIPDQAVPDMALPDKAMPDLAVPDKAMPDLAVPDQTPADMPPPDQGICGNNKVEGAEQCDGAVPKGKTCQTQGFKYGTLACDNKACKLDVSGCGHKPWPFGKDGVLKIGSKWGKTKVTLWPGEVKDYSEVIIESDGVLEVLPGSGWAIIGVNGNVKIDGKIVSRRQTLAGTITGKVPDAHGDKSSGSVASFTITQQAGGGGGGTHWTKKKYGGVAAGGNGGGGGSTLAHGQAATATKGGDGAVGQCKGSTCPKGGKGASQHGAPGGNGDTAPSIGGAPGGGGGFRGYHGGPLYMQVRGDVSGNGTIDLQGSPGGNGGNGGKAHAAYMGSGGGGGGAGGNGGRLVLKMTGVLKMFPAQFKVGGAKGGAGGAKGVCGFGSGTGGGPGKVGLTGSWTKLTW